MDRNKSVSSASSRSFLSRTLTRRDTVGEAIDVKGPLGLTPLHNPDHAIADLVFVHGLGGGSRSTWTKNGDPSLYWPKEWLSNDASFYDVRTYSFGYDSNWQQESSLSLYDFAKALLNSVQDSPLISRNSNQPLLFCGHSMGGLVIKRAYILAKQKPEYSSIAERTKAVMFLATPHRGADLAALLKRILSLSPGARPFVDDLNRNSPATQSINDEFPNFCQDLQLYSFYETLPMNYGIGKGLVVEKDLAVLGYANERSAYLNANHREVCKFADVSDPNYQTVRNALASIVDGIRSDATVTRQEVDADHERQLENYLGVSEAPENELMDAENLRMHGSCLWLYDRENFSQWQNASKASIYWISAAPATGKTVLSGSLIHHFKKEMQDLCYYFFDYRDKAKTSINGLLLSMAWQMAHLHVEALKIVLEICDKDSHLSKSDYRTIWRKLFVEGILRLNFLRPQYWVIDALDECKSDNELVSILLKVAELGPVRIFLTSRDTFETHRQPLTNRVQVFSDCIRDFDTKSDIVLYLEANRDKLPAVHEDARQKMVSKVLTKSAGCFLWVTLILDELRQVNTSREIDQVLEEVPSDMHMLYSRILEKMSAKSYGKALAKAILTWSVCSRRPLTTEELFHALELSLKDRIDNVEKAIVSNCGQLVHVDAQSQVQMVHQTARDFLLSPTLDSEFSISTTKAHKELAMTCLNYLNSKEMKGTRHRKLSTGSLTTERCAFVSYACNFYSEHLSLSQSSDRDLILAVTKFLNSSNVLAWIEYVAAHGNLMRLIQASKALKLFSRRLPNNTPGKDIALIKAWSMDLVRLVTKFGKNLLDYPPAIFDLIPPFCPSESAIRRQFAASARGISVVGPAPGSWDDLISTIILPEERFTALECSDKYFAIGMGSGRINIYNETTCQQEKSLLHKEQVRVLAFARRSDVLASAGNKILRVWNTVDWQEIWMYDTKQLCMSVAFVEEEQLLLGAMRNNELLIWDTSSGALRDTTDWTADLEGPSALGYRRPIAAAFCMASLLLAVVYRGQDILLWDLERDSLHDSYCKETGSRPLYETRSNTAGAIGLVFSLASNANLLAASYSDGDLVLFDTAEGTVLESTVANAQTLASSLDGRTLATGNSSGVIQLFEFESLKLLYRINSDEYGIQKLQFSGDNHRVLDIRGAQCRVWDPTILVRDTEDDAQSDTASEISTNLTETEFNDEEEGDIITAMCCPEEDDVYFLCGKDNGSLYAYEKKTGREAYKVFGEKDGASISAICLDDESKTLATVDVSSHITVRRLNAEHSSWAEAQFLLDTRIGSSVRQIILNSGATKLLITTAEMSTLWSISDTSSAILNQLERQDQRQFQWCTNPRQKDQLILIEANVAHLYDWHNLSRLTSDAGIVLEGDFLVDLSIKSIMPCFEGTTIATIFSEALKSQAESKLLLWEASDFKTDTVKVVPIPKFRSLASHIKIIVGGTTDDLVFLHSNNWICSANPESRKIEDFDWHFILPSDWLSANPNSLFGVTKKREIIFVKRDEVAVIKRGLESAELGPSVKGKRPSLRAVRS